MLYPIQNAMRNRLDLSGIWDFQIDPNEIGETAGWYNELPATRPIAVPGSWNEQYADIFNYFGLSWYLKRIYIPQSWQGDRIFIRVGSACYFGTVYVNGHKVGTHEGGHLPFAFDISDQVQWGNLNAIAISVENHILPTRVPSGNLQGEVDASSLVAGYPSTTFDFFPFAGLHRPVILYTTPQQFIQDITVVTGIEGVDGWVQVNVKVNGNSPQGRAVIHGGNQEVNSEIQFIDLSGNTTLRIPEARFWSDIDPYLYDLTITTDSDCYSLKIGIRTIRVVGNQILLNNQPVQLNGFGRHEDFYASGKGLNLPLMVKDYQLMRWTGANSYRTSHYPYSEEEMMMADREGFLIIDETPAVNLKFENEENIQERYRMCIQQIEELVTRDKNHPSIVMWSVANEPMPPDMLARFTSGEVDGEKEIRCTKFLHNLISHVRQLDTTRLVTFAGIMAGPLVWMEKCDVVCINRYWGWYINGGELEKGLRMLDQELDGLWDALKKPIIVTEFGADCQPGLHGHPAVMWTEEYQAALIRGYLETAASKHYLVGMQVWNFADFAAVQSMSRVGGMNMKGVFTRARQPKMAAHVLREFWVTRADSVFQDTDAPDTPEVLDIMDIDIQSQMKELAYHIDCKKSDLTITLKFDFYDGEIYRMILDKGACHIEAGEGDADATIHLTLMDFKKLLEGKLNPMIAKMTGRIETKGDVRAFTILLNL